MWVPQLYCETWEDHTYTVGETWIYVSATDGAVCNSNLGISKPSISYTIPYHVDAMGTVVQSSVVDVGVMAWDQQYAAGNFVCYWQPNPVRPPDGNQQRTRTIAVQPQNNGQPCPMPMTENRGCQTSICPIDCVIGSWTEWTSCSRTCGGGTQTRTRQIVSEPQFGGINT